MLLKDMAMKSLDRQLKLMTLVTIYVEICSTGNALICCKVTDIDMHILALARAIVIVVHVVVVI